MITAGVDVGSTYTKVAILNNSQRVGYGIVPTGVSVPKAAQEAMNRALEMGGLEQNGIQHIVSTGYGRRATDLSYETISEISANARGAKWLGQKHGIRTVIDIGGQDTKVISLDERCEIANFAMNDKCAAGTGRFLEVLANVMEVPLDEMGDWALKSKNPLEISTTCLVFAKSEIGTYVVDGIPKEDIIAGIHLAIARRLLVMAKRVGIQREVFFDGGPARNIGMVKTFEKELGFPIFVPDNPQIVTATGAALLAAESASGQQIDTQGPQITQLN